MKYCMLGNEPIAFARFVDAKRLDLKSMWTVHLPNPGSQSSQVVNRKHEFEGLTKQISQTCTL